MSAPTCPLSLRLVGLALSALLLTACSDEASRQAAMEATKRARAEAAAESEAEDPPQAPLSAAELAEFDGPSAPLASDPEERATLWWARATESLAQIEDPAAQQWARCQLALGLNELGRTEEALALIDGVPIDGLSVFVLERLAMLAWRDGDPARFETLAARVAELVPELGNPNDRLYHHGLLFVIQVARGDLEAAERSWLVASRSGAMTSELERDFALARLGLLAAFGDEHAWRSAWRQIHEQEPELADMAPLLRGMLYARQDERVATWLENSLEGAVGDGGTIENEELRLAQRLVLDWSTDGFALESLPLWDRLSAREDWPAAQAPTAELLAAMTEEERVDEARAWLDQLPEDDHSRGVFTVALAHERAGRSADADELLQTFALDPTPGVRIRRHLARAEHGDPGAESLAALELFLTYRSELGVSDADLLGLVVEQLHEAGALAGLRRLAAELRPLLLEPQALPTLVAIELSAQQDERAWEHALEVFAGRPELLAAFAAQAAIVSRNGPLADLPSLDLTLRPDHIAGAWAEGLRGETED